ncbi:MAG: carboxypeptidase regulatory-like domain-containing protein [Holophaga sp.]|nr:carboxypeptidase regulatory-like domain-containing protein [Holophaga sp.]
MSTCSEGWYGACTDAQGHYTINGAPYGPNKVHAGGGWNWCANAPSPYIEQFYNKAPYAELGASIILSSTQTSVSGIDFQLQPGGTIRGRVTSALSGQGLSGVNVTAWAPSAKNWAGTDPNGYYTMTGLTAADYQISVDPNTLPPGLGQIYYPAALTQSGASLVSVTQGGDVGGIDLVLPAGGTISGRVLNAANGSPVANTSVNAAMVGPEQGPGTCTDQNGNYTLKGLPYADYTVNVGGDWDWCRNQSSPYIRQWYDHVSDFVLASHLTVSAASPDIQNINFDLAVGGTSRPGDRRRHRPAGWQCPCRDPRPLHRQRPDRRQHRPEWLLHHQPGRGQLPPARRSPQPARRLRPDLLPQHHQLAVRRDGHHLRHPDHHRSQPGPAARRLDQRTVTDKQTGLPVANLNLNAGNVNLPFGIGSCTDANGYYTLPGLPYSTYNVNTDGNWNWCTNQPAVYPSTLYSATYQWNNAVQFEIGPAQPNYNSIDLHMEKGAFIQGTVKDEAGKPGRGHAAQCRRAEQSVPELLG